MGYQPYSRASKSELDAFTRNAFYGDLGKIKNFVKTYPAYIDEEDACGRTAILRAIEGNEFSVFKYLIKSDAIVDNTNSKLIDAFVNAGPYDETDFLKLMIRKGFDINVKDSEGETALTMAIKERKTNNVKYLIKNGAVVDNNNRNFKNAFISLAFWGDEKLICILLQAGADVNCKNYDNQTPLVKAIRGEEISIAKYLIKSGATVDLKDRRLVDAFVNAASYKDTSFLKLIIEQGFDINTKNSEGETALTVAVKEREVNNVKYLLNNGAIIDKDSGNFENNFVSLAFWGKISLIEVLLKAGADVNCEDYACNTALVKAIRGNEISTAKFLIKSGASVYLRDIDAFINSASYSETYFLKLMIEQGFDINSKNSEGKTALTVAVKEREINNVKYLLNNGAIIDNDSIKFRNAFVPLAFWGKLSLIEILLKAGADINSINGYKETLLTRAIRGNEDSTAKYLIKSGADIYIKDYEGLCALDFAVKENQISIIKLLKEKIDFDNKVKEEEVERLELERAIKAKEELESRTFNAARAIKEIIKESGSSEVDGFYKLIEGGDIHSLRNIFDLAFYDRRKLKISSKHMKLALLKENMPVLRLLTTWGGSIGREDLEEIKLKDEKKYLEYLSILRRSGVKLSTIVVNNNLKILKRNNKL